MLRSSQKRSSEAAPAACAQAVPRLGPGATGLWWARDVAAPRWEWVDGKCLTRRAAA